MAQHMKDRIVALAGPRKAADMAKLVEKMGGTAASSGPGTVFLDDEVLRRSIEAWLKAPAPWAIFTTGIGLEAIYDTAEQMGLLDTLNETLQRTSMRQEGTKRQMR